MQAPRGIGPGSRVPWKSLEEGQWWPAAGLGALSIAVCAWALLKEVAVIFITSTIVWPQVKQQRGNTALPFNRKLDKRFTEHDTAYQSKTQFSPQSVPPIRKLENPSHGRQRSKNFNPMALRMKTTITEN